MTATRTDQAVIAEFTARVCAAHKLPEPTEADIRLILSMPMGQRGPMGDYIAGVVAALAYIRQLGV